MDGARLQRWQQFLGDLRDHAAEPLPFEPAGKLTRVAGLVMECVGLRLAVGSACTIPLPNGAKIEAEVVGFEGERLLHRAFFRWTWVQQVNPNRAAQIAGGSDLFRRFPGWFGQGGRDFGNGAFAHAAASILNGPGCEHGAGPPRGKKRESVLTLARQPG